MPKAKSDQNLCAGQGDHVWMRGTLEEVPVSISRIDFGDM